MKMKFALVFSLLLFVVPVQAYAQKAPVEIEASQQLEWLRDKNIYRATGDVVITQGDTVIKGDTAEAEYDPVTGPSDLTVFTVTGNVVMTKPNQTVHADKGIYDTRTELLILSGDTVTLKTPTMTITSKGGMAYDAAKGQATAKGNAHVHEASRDVKADTITAFMSKKDNKLERATADGRVIITMNGKEGKDVAQAQHGDYDLVKNTITLRGDVKLTRGTNHMQGDYATINLTTGVSSLQNNASKGGRVRAIFTSGDSATPLPNVTGTVPMVNSKKEFEQPYAVGR